MARKLRQKLGEILVQNKVVPESKVAEALQTAKGSGKRLGEVLIEMGACTEEDVARALGAQFGMEFLNLERAEDSAKIDMSLIKEADAKKFLVLPMAKAGGRLKIVIHDPMDLDTLEVLRFKLGAELDTCIASRRQISYYLDGDKKGAAVAQQTASLLTDSIDKSVDKSVDRSVDKSIDVESDEAPMVRLVNRIIIEGVTGRASDIHVEPMADGVVVRYRIDGVCVVRDKLPKRNQAAILARFKLMAGVNMAEKRIPQDGRIKLVVEGTAIDFRVSTCPAYHGESVVLRILRPDSVRIGLVNLGLEQDTLDTFNKVIRRPNGIFLVTGPTGSGKTTTLYSALDTLNRPDRKIITAEDPVEYNFKGINQVQVREHIGLTFPSILKSMLRQAPNIILVGEIRDREVADIAIQAALTGHLVFSTLHTNDAPSAITRLIDMGVKPFLVASSIQAVLAQRLVRILCDKCKGPDPDVDPKLLKLVGISELERDQVMGPKGCPACGGVGYKGRRGIYEMMIMNAEIRQLAFERSGISKLRSAAVRNGMRGLLGDGRLKILKGRTTPEEIAKFAQIEGFDPATEMAV
ncbi:MAG: GspE/PulE family protein [Phycisphaerales bacterium]